jgi:diguanylate cyclase (GGDEF)-like protein/PAS domain S-box-containing protein
MGKPLRLLCVEDSVDDLDLLSRVLRRDGYDLMAVARVETATAMKEALARDTWDIILSDYFMPCCSGLEALSVLKETGLDIPFILVSGKIGEEAAVASMRAGASDYVMKSNLARLPHAIARELSDAASRRERKRLEESLGQKAYQHRVVLDTVGDGILMLDRKGVIVYANPAALRILGDTTGEIIGKPMEHLIDPFESCAHTHPETPIPIAMTLENGVAHTVAHEWFRHCDATVLPISYSSTPIREHAEVVGAVIIFQELSDASMQKVAMATLSYHAMHDPLTHLPNRALLYDRLKHAMVGAQREHKRLALILLDLDRFKEVNDTLGHAAGDLLLQEVGLRLRSAVRDLDTAARLGGDEFAVLLQTGSDVQNIAVIASKILRALHMPYQVAGQTLSVRASLGVALFPDHAGSANLLLERADIAMFSAKRQKSGYALYSPEQDARSDGHIPRVGDLRQAIEENGLRLYYQPKVSLKSGHTIEAEALVRWKHPRQGLVLPDQFIPFAEQTDLIVPLTQWVLETALTQCHDWRKSDMVIPIVINLSGRDLQETDLSRRIAEALRAHNLSPDCLAIEIVESAIMFDGGRSITNLWHLKQMGIKLSIDDFGTGYSSLSYLKKLPVDEIKIDRSFISNLTMDRDDAAIVSSTIDLAHNLGLSVVAEGVENQGTWDRLCDLGCDMAQGYYICRPTAAAEISSWLTESPMGLERTIGLEQ